MKTVVYSADFEPITVVDLPFTPERILKVTGGLIRLPAFRPLQIKATSDPDLVESVPPIVTLTMEPLRWKDGSRKWVFIADCDENALLLKAAWLPGQQGAINEYERSRKAMAALLLQALQRNLGSAD